MDNHIIVSARELRWKCTELRKDNERLYYGRFVLSPLLEGQADLIGLCMRRALLGNMEATCITCAKFLDIAHGYSNIPGVEESIHDIVMNLQKIVLRSKERTSNGPKIYRAVVRRSGDFDSLTAKDIHFINCDIKIIDGTQHIARFTKNVGLVIDLDVETRRGFEKKRPFSLKEGHFPIDAAFLPVLNVSYSVHSYTHLNEKKEALFLEIWTDGSLTPVEAHRTASEKLAELFSAPLRTDDEENLLLSDAYFVSILTLTLEDKWELLRKEKMNLSVQSILIEQFKFSTKVYSGLTGARIFTTLDLFNKSYNDLMKIPLFGLQDLREITLIVENFFEIYLQNEIY